MQHTLTELLPCARPHAPWKGFSPWNEISVQFSHSVMSNSSQPHGLQHARFPCPSPTPRACWNSCPSNWWCHSTISSSVVPFSCLQYFPAAVSFPVLCIRWPKYWSFSFSISPSNEYSGLVSFRIDWFDLLAVQRTQESSPTPQFKSIRREMLRENVFQWVWLSLRISKWELIALHSGDSGL